MLRSQKTNLIRLGRTLGYEFNDSALAELALSHRSVGKVNNERLEFLGDSLLNLFIAEALFKKFPKAPEGDLSRLRAHLVKGDTLATIAKEMNLGEYVLLGGGELKSGGHRRESILADMVEALIGGIYIDSDMDTCKARVLDWYAERLSEVTIKLIDKDPKTRLQEFMQERGKRLPIYTVCEELGESHAREYRIECAIVGTSELFTATASSKRGAEKKAAAAALTFLGLDSDD